MVTLRTRNVEAAASQPDGCNMDDNCDSDLECSDDEVQLYRRKRKCGSKQAGNALKQQVSRARQTKRRREEEQQKDALRKKRSRATKSTAEIPTGEEVQQQQWEDLANRLGLHRQPSAPPIQPVIEVAKSFRDVLDRQCCKEVCAVCSMYVRKVDITTLDLEDVPNLDLLRSDVEMSEEERQRYPRDGLTIWREWCLQEAGITVEGEESEEEVKVAVCKNCLKDLENDKIPDTSLVAFDTGEKNALDEKLIG
jgi:hypothetical protein